MNLLKILTNRFSKEKLVLDPDLRRKYSADTLPVLLKSPRILLIGGGKVALQKAKVLKLNNISFEIVTSDIIEELRGLDIIYKLKKFEENDLRNYNIVINATGSKEVSSLLDKIKKRRFILLNSVDVPEECDFYFSSLLIYNSLKIAVSSNGASPTLTQVVRDKIREIIPPKLGELANSKLAERSNDIVNIIKVKKEIKELFGKIFLVGCGPGSADLLTLRALNVIQSAEIILHDFLVSDDILKYAKNDAQIFCVGKEKGNHSFTQEEINKALLQYAKDGYQVARLKGGDPYVFGRGAEEAEYLIDNNVDVEVVPGISSSLAAPLLAGIPPTHRDYSSGFSVVTCCSKNEIENFNWLINLNIKKHTTIVLMGVTQADKIFAQGIERGINLNTPMAIISNASNENQKIQISTFGNIIQAAKESERPAIMIFGDVVNLHDKLYKSLSGSINLPIQI